MHSWWDMVWEGVSLGLIAASTIPLTFFSYSLLLYPSKFELREWDGEEGLF